MHIEFLKLLRLETIGKDIVHLLVELVQKIILGID